MGLLVPDQVKFCNALGSLMGFSQRVIGAWCLAEDSGGAAISKAASGDNNWLNVEAFDSGWSAFATAHKPWATPTTAAQTTWHWINTKADPPGSARCCCRRGTRATVRSSPRSSTRRGPATCTTAAVTSSTQPTPSCPGSSSRRHRTPAATTPALAQQGRQVV